MYQNSYGETHFPRGFEKALELRPYRRQYRPAERPADRGSLPRARAATIPARDPAATLDDYGALLWAAARRIPGGRARTRQQLDPWRRPATQTRSRASSHLQRLYDGFAAETLTPARLAFGRGLAMVAEHTWGVDIKSYLRDETAWDRPAFEAARAERLPLQYSEASWAEQRAYLDHAVAELAGPTDIATAVDAALRVPPATAGGMPRTPAAAAGRRLTLRLRSGNRRPGHHPLAHRGRSSRGRR